MLWFVGGYIHAKRRMQKGLPLLAYHRVRNFHSRSSPALPYLSILTFSLQWLVPYRERQRYGQTPQNHFTFYATQPYSPNADGTYNEPPPLYNNDMPPSYMPPPGASKLNPTQTAMEMQPSTNMQHTSGFGAVGAQETGVVGGGQRSDLESQSADLPPRPPRARIAAGNAFGWLRK